LSEETSKDIEKKDGGPGDDVLILNTWPDGLLAFDARGDRERLKDSVDVKACMSVCVCICVYVCL